MVSTFALAVTFAKPEVAAWVVAYNPESIRRFEEKASQLDAVYVEYYGITKDGTLARRDQNKSFFQRARAIAKKNKVRLYVMVNNYGTNNLGEQGFDPGRVSRFLATPTSQQKFATDLYNFVRQDGADGVDLDLESLYPGDRNRYSAFAQTLSSMLHRSILRLSITVHPKDTLGGTWDGARALDYEALGAAADRVNIMTYDFSWSGTNAGPIAPTPWVEQVVNFARSQMPASKIGLGVACYGYDWTKSPATSLRWIDFKNAKYTVDPTSGEYMAGDLRFSGAQALRAKYDMATRMGVGSLALWYCGCEDPKIWDFIPKRKI